MSTVTSQPRPFDRLEREKHIEMIFRAFKNRCGPACQRHVHLPGSKPHQTSPDWVADEQSALAPGRKVEGPPTPARMDRIEEEEQLPGGAAGTNIISVLEAVTKIHITARPELQGEEKFLCPITDT